MMIVDIEHSNEIRSPIPNKIIEEILRYKKSGTVLDLGVGWGRNALFLASEGFDVTGVDNNPNSIALFKQKASEIKVDVKGEIADIQNYKIDRTYDIIIANSTLHFIDKPEKIIEAMKAHTEEGGLNAISAFTKENHDKGFAHLFEQNELRSYYEEWEILHYNEYLTDWEQHDNLKPHRHFIAEIIARKAST